MKFFLILSGIVSFALIFGGAFFRILHLPGGQVMLLLGLIALVFIFLPLVIVFVLRRRKSGEM